MAKVLSQAGLEHLIDRLDERYGGVDTYIPDATIYSILQNRYEPEDRDGSSGFSDLTDAAARADSNAHEPKSNRVLNYPGLVHLIPRLDKRYAPAGQEFTVERITNFELEAMLQ